MLKEPKHFVCAYQQSALVAVHFNTKINKVHDFALKGDSPESLCRVYDLRVEKFSKENFCQNRLK